MNTLSQGVFAETLLSLNSVGSNSQSSTGRENMLSGLPGLIPSVANRCLHKNCVYLLLALWMFSSVSDTLSAQAIVYQASYNVKDSLREPAIFAPGVISTGDYESHPAFTPDGKTLYFLKDSPDFSFWTIFVSEFRDGQWSKPEVAPFSGQYKDADPFISGDGTKFLFISSRPLPGKKHRDLDIWMMERKNNAWTEPHNIGAPVNSDGNEWYPTLAADGTLYFGSDRPGGLGKTDLYRSRLIDGKYAEPENLGRPINSDLDEFEPYVAPDQSFLIFMGDNRERRGDFDLYISHQQNGTWTEPLALAANINSAANEFSPKISPDGKYFFWTSTRNARRPVANRLTTNEYLNEIRSPGNGLGDIYQIDVEALHLKQTR